ncbi:MAG TPA: hypothetical protein VK249_16840, partial [Anaerolineales bacterium]|nr:hypothetical protein [Anaerolineales bacterium]
VVMPYHQRGQVVFQKNRWRLTGGGFLQSYMRIFGQEGLGRPDIESEGEIRALKKYFLKYMDEAEIPEINAMMVFTNETVEIKAGDSPIPALKLKQMKEFIRQRAKTRMLSQEKLRALTAVVDDGSKNK